MSDRALLELLDRIDDLELDEYFHLDDYKCIAIVKETAKEIRTRMAASPINQLNQYFKDQFKNGCPYSNDCECHEEECDHLPEVSELGHDVDCMWLEVFDIIKEEEKKDEKPLDVNDHYDWHYGKKDGN